MEFSKESIQQGLKNQEASLETPESFGTIDGADVARPTRDLDKQNSRMAGQVGSYALQLMNDPNALAVKDAWMSKFGFSNEGMQFNQAKMMMSQPAPAPEEK